MASSTGREKAGSQSLKALLGIRELVFGGNIAPGERLSEVDMSDRLGISRTPVRAALARLEQEGLLEAIPSGGYSVRSFSEADVIDAIELRGVLEGTAARLAAERGVQPAKLTDFKTVVERLDTIIAVPVDELDFAAYEAGNAEFHDMLAGLAGSRIIRREIERVARLPFAGPSAFLNAQTDIPAFRKSLGVGQTHHRAICQAIELREGARAEAMAREHARHARQNLAFVMKDETLIERIPGLRLMSA